MSKYKPKSELHAVDQAVVGVRLFQAAAEDTYKAAVAEAARLADPSRFDLPGRVQLDPFSLAFGRQVIAPGYAMNGDVTSGTLFQRVQADGQMAEELTVERDVVTFRTRSYRRWKDMERRIEGLLIPVASILAANSIDKVSVVELRCVDLFTAPVEPALPLSALLRTGSEYLPAHLLDRTEQSHLHTGWFDEVSESGRFLLNLNIDVTNRDESTRTATILQAISKQARASGVFFGDGSEFTLAILSVFKDLHSRDKSLLSKVLTDEMQEAIDLKGSTGVH